MSLHEILALLKTRTPTSREVDSYCTAAGLNVESALSSIAVAVARRYAAGAMDFGECDRVVNRLYGWSITERDAVLPEPAHRVFLAFDEGEYRHRGDSDDTDTEMKYTRPMITQLLRDIDAV